MSQPQPLRNDEVHVWGAVLDVDVAQVHSLHQTLAADERARAERFHFRQDRQHFIVARGVLRGVLGRYLGLEPGHLQFCYNPYGKPALVTTPEQDVLNFNLAHSHGLALVAVARNREIGIDLERIRTDFACEEVAERFFSAQENAVLRALPAEAKYEAFFTCWTRKEAYIKARGEGLSLPLDQFDVSLAPGEPARLLNTTADAGEAGRWSLQELRPGPGYIAALAVEGHSWRLHWAEWPV